MREIARFYDVEEAQVALGYLKAQGFNVLLPEFHTLGAQPSLRVGLCGYRILAAEQDASAAAAALAAQRPKSPFGPCPNCGSNNTRRQREWRFPVVHLLVGAIVPFAPPTNRYRCGHCGHKWKDDDHVTE